MQSNVVNITSRVHDSLSDGPGSSSQKILSNGIEVMFPFPPYMSQINYIDKVTRALLDGTNALLESPTGTGKTLCLLCASLGWQKYINARTPQGQKSQLKYNDGPNTIKGITNLSVHRPSVIIYASRTHAQLAQVVSELKNSGYAPRLTVLGSREQLCIHPKISSLKGGALNHACNTITAQRGCMMKNNLESYIGAAEGVGSNPSPLLDIEQLTELGRRDGICPYFFSRDNSQSADLILLPYNYLVDISIRATLKVDWDNAVIIFDEAHNLESVASDATSFSISSTDIAACIGEMQQVIRLVQMKTGNGASKDENQTRDDKNSGGGSGSNNVPDLDKCATILSGLFTIEKKLDSLPLQPLPAMDSVGKILPGGWMVEMLESSGFRIELAVSMIEEIIKCANYLVDDISATLNEGNGSGFNTTARASEPKLENFAKALAKIFRGRNRLDCVANSVFYRVYVAEDSGTGGKGGGYNNRNNTYSSSHVSAIGIKKRILNYWCFSTGMAMEDLKRLGIRSIILTSGTLAPLSSFRDDLKIPFPIELENPHVIRDKQVWIGAVSHGVNSNVELNSTFAKRENVTYKDELGNSILLICQTMLGRRTMISTVPIPEGPELKGGVLIFVPSYGVLESLKSRWVETGLWEKLRSVMGTIVVESKQNSALLNSENKIPYSKKATVSFSGGNEADNSVSAANTAVENSIALFDSAIKGSGGRAILLAVCRGKMSEGIDFRDSKGRVVILTGLPYAPQKDPWVVMKRDYLDKAASSAQFIKAGELVTRKINGQEWYDQSAMRAVNQALGRVIRHKNDWGAVFLLDPRFQNASKISQLSKWVQHRVQKFNGSVSSVNSFRLFLTAAMSDTDLNSTHKILNQAPRSIPAYVPYPVTSISDSNMAAVPTREVVVSAKNLGLQINSTSVNGNNTTEPRELVYVDPEFLLTQQSQSHNLKDIFGIATVKGKSFGDINEYLPSRSDDIENIVIDIQSSVSQGYGINKSDSQGVSGKQNTLSEILSRKTSFPDRKDVPIIGSNLHQSSYSNRGVKSSISQTEIKKVEKVNNIEKSLVYSIGLSSVEKETKCIAEESDTRYSFVKAISDDVKKKAPRDIYEAFRDEIVLVIKSTELLAQLTKLRGFVDKIFGILRNFMRPQSILEIFMRLTPLIPQKVASLYGSLTRKLCQNSVNNLPLDNGSNQTSDIKPEVPRNAFTVLLSRPEVTASAELSVPLFLKGNSTNSQFTDFRPQQRELKRDIVSDLKDVRKRIFSLIDTVDQKQNEEEVLISSLSQSSTNVSSNVVASSSKRARSMALINTPATPAALKQSAVPICQLIGSSSNLTNNSRHSSVVSVTSRNNAIDTVALMDKIGNITGSGKSMKPNISVNEEKVNKKLVVCALCNEKVLSPFAARCGHISCMDCWLNWTKLKESCPICRRPVLIETLTKIVIGDL